MRGLARLVARAAEPNRRRFLAGSGATLATLVARPLLGALAVREFAGYERVRQGNVLFAGEHCNVPLQGFMEGAAREGIRAAHDVLRDLGIRAASTDAAAFLAAPPAELPQLLGSSGAVDRHARPDQDAGPDRAAGVPKDERDGDASVRLPVRNPEARASGGRKAANVRAGARRGILVA